DPSDLTEPWFLDGSGNPSYKDSYPLRVKTSFRGSKGDTAAEWQPHSIPFVWRARRISTSITSQSKTGGGGVILLGSRGSLVRTRSVASAHAEGNSPVPSSKNRTG